MSVPNTNSNPIQDKTVGKLNLYEFLKLCVDTYKLGDQKINGSKIGDNKININTILNTLSDEQKKQISSIITPIIDIITYNYLLEVIYNDSQIYSILEKKTIGDILNKPIAEVTSDAESKSATDPTTAADIDKIRNIIKLLNKNYNLITQSDITTIITFVATHRDKINFNMLSDLGKKENLSKTISYLLLAITITNTKLTTTVVKNKISDLIIATADILKPYTPQFIRSAIIYLLGKIGWSA